MPTIWVLSLADWLALLLFVTFWLGFAPFTRWRASRQKTAAGAMVDHRRNWMYELIGRDMKVHDTAIVGHIMSTAGFFASTTVIVIGALLGVLINVSQRLVGAEGGLLPLGRPTVFELKILLILAVAFYAFQSFTWAIRQANFAAVLMGAAPPASKIDDGKRAEIALHMGRIITGVADSYDKGLRSYYFALGALTWLAGPIAFAIATVGVFSLLLYRQTKSGTAMALKEIGRIRAT